MKSLALACLALGSPFVVSAPLSADTLTDTAKRELTPQMQAFSETIQEHDLAARFAFYTPDYTFTMFDGATLNRELAEKVSTHDRGPVPRQLTQRIDRVVLADNEVRLYCHSRGVFPWRNPDPALMLAAPPRTLTTEADYCFVWMKTPQGWRLKQLQELSKSQMTLDGKPYLPPVQYIKSPRP